MVHVSHWRPAGQLYPATLFECCPWRCMTELHNFQEGVWTCSRSISWTTVVQPSLTNHQTGQVLSHELRLNLLSSVKSTGCQWGNFPILVVYGKRQSRSTVPGSENRAHYRTSSPQATLMESVSDCLVRNINTSGLLEVDILKGCGSAHSCTKEQILLRVSGSFKGLSGSADETTY